MDKDAFQKQIEAGRKALENAQQALNPSRNVASTPNDEAQTLAQEKKAHKPKPKLPEPIRPVSTGFTSVRLTKAPKPPTEVGGRGLARYSPKPLRMPSRPDDFPGDLWPRAVVILAKAIERFRDENHLTELCEHVVEEITPLYCEAVETGKVKAHTVLDDRSGMAELLRLLLVANDPGHSSWGLSKQAWDILQKVKAATCWGKLAEAIDEAQRDSTGAERLRTGIKQAESPRVQNNDKTAQAVETKTNTLRHKRDPEVAKRTALVGSNLDASAQEMCDIFDREGVPLSRKWQEAGLKTWRQAYKDANYRSKIDTLISKDRGKN